MKTRHLLIPALCVCHLLLSTGPLLGEDEASADQLPGKLVGTWKMVSAKYGGRKNQLPERLIVLKHITPTHSTWMRIEPDTGEVVAMGGGGWKMEGNEISETPTYGMGSAFETVKGQTHTFTCEIVGDKWHHTGELANGLTIEEIYERVKKEQ